MSNVKKYQNLPVFFVDESAFENDAEMKNAIKTLSKACSEIECRYYGLRTCTALAIHALLGTVSPYMLINIVRGNKSVPSFVHATRLVDDDESAIEFAEECRKGRPKNATVYDYKTW
jgi:hypothetical protein